MSYQGTLNIVEKITEDHDKDVQFWAGKMKEKIEERRVRERVDIITIIRNTDVYNTIHKVMCLRHYVT